MPISSQNEIEIKKQIDLYSHQVIKGTNNLSYNKDSKNKILQDYKEIRDETSKYMKKNKSGDVVIDRHKIAAVIVLSILKNKPLSIKNDKIASARDRGANIYLSYMVALGVIMDFYKEENNKELSIVTPCERYIQEYHNLILNNSKLLERVYTKTDFKEREFSQSVFFISHIFYFIEEYSVLLMEK